MKAFIVSLQQLFAMDNGCDEHANFASAKRQLRIPMYQREYKWDDSIIECLIRDISSRDKFLGITILDEVDDGYEIVDGQQRITTCFLAFVSLYNLHSAQPLEQQSILNAIRTSDGRAFVLKNDSVGDFINNCNGCMGIAIDDEADIYFQKNTFMRAYTLINNKLLEINNRGQLRDFQNKLKDCQFLIMINDKHQHTQPIEQVFLDINEKAQRLDNEAVFKGHCFENFTNDALHPYLKQLWTELKHVGLSFVLLFGYEDMNQYLYHYFLANHDKSFPQNMSPNGEHILEGTSMDDTEILLKDMISYGKDALEFRRGILQDDYRFTDICTNSHEYRNTADHLMLKSMSKDILNSGKPFYQKLPFWVLVHNLYLNVTDFQEELTHNLLKKIITNLYIYSSLFIARTGRKSKSDIDDSIRNSFKESNDRINKAANAAKLLRRNAVDSFSVNPQFKEGDAFFLYSIIDNYKANENWLSLKYSRDNGYTVEHLLIHDNRGMRVRWRDSEQEFDFALSNQRAPEYKRKTINYLVLPRELNEEIGHDDIESKNRTIRHWFQQREMPVPAHIQLFLTHIESLQSYQTLVSKKGQTNDEDEVVIADMYNAFIEEYFNPQNQVIIQEKVRQAFVDAFRNEG